MYEKLGIANETEELVNNVEKEIETILKKIDKDTEYNSIRVLNAFQKYKVSDIHFTSTTGYGYDDIGRECVENVFADVLGAEDALVRTQIVSGTHALTVALFAFLRPNDVMLSIVGKPYDTLDAVIGIEENASSLKAFGVKYEQIDLLENEFDTQKIIERVKKGGIKLIHIQRSRGYSLRETMTIEQDVIEVEEKVVEAPKPQAKKQTQTTTKTTAKTKTKKETKEETPTKPAAPEVDNASPVVVQNYSRLGFDVIGGSFSSRANAERLARKAKSLGYDSYVLSKVKSGTPIYYVSYGSRRTLKEANDLMARMVENLGGEYYVISR